MQKKFNLIFILLFLFLSACALRPQKPTSKKATTESVKIETTKLESPQSESQNPLLPPQHDAGVSSSNIDPEDIDENAAQPGQPEVDQPTPQKRDSARLGIILGPGAARSYAYIGFLKELEKNKIPVHAIAGVEFGAITAALYANKASANEVEWQMTKLREEDIFSGGIIASNKFMNKPENMNDFLNKAFGNLKAEDLKVKFSCPAFNLNKNTTFIMNTGKLSYLLPYCIAQPPLFSNYKGNVADTYNISMVTQHLKKLGANYIVYVNIIPDTPPGKYLINKSYDSVENLLWFNIGKTIDEKAKDYTYQLKINLVGFDIYDFSKKRELMLKGSQLTEKVIQQLAEKLGY